MPAKTRTFQRGPFRGTMALSFSPRAVSALCGSAPALPPRPVPWAAATATSRSRELRSKGLAVLAASAVAQVTRTRPGAGAVPWPDKRLWVRKLPDGTAEVSTIRSADAFMAFDAYSQPRPGTREICLGDLCFFCFVGPRLGAEHLVLWRRVADVQERAEQYQAAAAAQTAGMSDTVDQALLRDAPLRLTKCSDKAQLTAAVWRWEKLDERDPNRYWEVGNDSWMYWESFWAPAEDAALAMDSPAFGDLNGVMLQPTLPASTLLIDAGNSILDQDLPQGAEEERRARAAMKDKAYSIVYEYNVWGSDVSRSGTGSDLWSPEARLAVTALEAVVDAFGIRSMLDCACGDATWMVPFFVTRHPEIQYTGVDVVSEVIQRNQQRHPRINFLAQDLSEMPLPQGAQLIFSKETLNHMHLHDAQRALQQFAQTGARYLLTNVHEGVDNFVGAEKTCHTTYIKYDYELPPFSLPKVLRVNEYQGLETSFTLFQLNPE